MADQILPFDPSNIAPNVAKPYIPERSAQEEKERLGAKGLGLFSQQVAANIENTSGYWYDLYEKTRLESKAKSANEKYLSVDELNKKYPSGKFTEALPDSVASYVNRRNESRDALNEMVGIGNPGMISQVASGFVAAPFDPVGLILGFGAGKLAGALARPVLSKIPFTAKLFAKNPGYVRRFTGEMAENLVGIQATSYAVHEAAKEMQRDMPAFGLNAESVGMAAFMSALGAIGKRSYKEAAAKPATEQVKAASSVLTEQKADHVYKNWEFKQSGAINPDVPGDVGFRPLTVKSEVFVPAQVEGSRASVGRYGLGVYGTDSALPANAHGDFFSGRVQVKLLDVEQPNSKLIKTLDGKLGLEKRSRAKLSVKEYLDVLEVEEASGNIPPEYMSIVRDELKAQGYGGFSEKYIDGGQPRYNKVFLFDEEGYAQERLNGQRTELIPDDISTFEGTRERMVARTAYEADLVKHVKRLSSAPEMKSTEVQALLREHEARTIADIKEINAALAASESGQMALEETLPPPVPEGGEQLGFDMGDPNRDLRVGNAQEIFDVSMRNTEITTPKTQKRAAKPPSVSKQVDVELELIEQKKQVRINRVKTLKKFVKCARNS